MARVRNVDLANGLDAAANELRKSSTLIGTALRLLIDNPDIKDALETSLGTLGRVLNVVDWPTVSKGDPEAWLYFYEGLASRRRRNRNVGWVERSEDPTHPSPHA